MLVHDDPDFVDAAAAALIGADHEVRIYSTALAALIDLEKPPQADLLITRIRFGPGNSNGVALAFAARRRFPGIKILFTASPEFRAETADLGVFLATPVAVPDLLDTVNILLA
jgi:hypothetical protein